MQNFRPSQTEVTMDLQEGECVFRNYVPDSGTWVRSNSSDFNAVITHIPVASTEFEAYRLGEECDLTFCQKDFRVGVVIIHYNARTYSVINSKFPLLFRRLPSCLANPWTLYLLLTVVDPENPWSLRSRMKNITKLTLSSRLCHYPTFQREFRWIRSTLRHSLGRGPLSMCHSPPRMLIYD